VTFKRPHLQLAEEGGRAERVTNTDRAKRSRTGDLQAVLASPAKEKTTIKRTGREGKEGRSLLATRERLKLEITRGRPFKTEEGRV